MALLSRDFFAQTDTLRVARHLLGKHLHVRELHTGEVCTLRITETEAYCGTTDRACHAFGGRRTARNEVMYGPPGYVYIYLCYGIHHLLNFVTHQQGEPHAILIRAGEPVAGLQTMLTRRSMQRYEPRLAAGPGSLARALGLTVADSGRYGCEPHRIWVTDAPLIDPEAILEGPRVGVEYAEEDARLPWRFRIRQ
ncbi:MAG: DNA-3-methyladenine glycosylase [Bacteroidetes bacterium]|nr:DNA-3-methyladenine glycosylase [Bacteroidota bacterium]